MENNASTAAGVDAPAAKADSTPLRLRAPDGAPLELEAQKLVAAALALVACGAAVFVGLRWHQIGPAAQAAAVLGLVALPHAAAMAVRARRPRLATALHVLGTLMMAGALAMLGGILALDGYGLAAALPWLMAALAGWWLGTARAGERRGWMRSLALLGLQAMLAASALGLSAVQRWEYPRAWVQAQVVGVDGRYVQLSLTVDGCRSTLPSAKEAAMPRDLNGRPVGRRYTVRAAAPVEFLAQLRADRGGLEAIREEGTEHAPRGVAVRAEPGASCDALRLAEPVRAYVTNPAQVGAEMRVELTVLPRGMPRVIEAVRTDKH